ncbi:hypothetical protein CWB96_10910 [Pseudoalteromonas citrea]|uniref:Fimbrial assembly protein n=1 Tax=Pseudoalteromonas citrea TaxID=43655 RepID=A0A5S3XRC7_9GAMM|nr:hypothetical protein [Pseudoalteromonas citrea]TMP45686.1 hypothetical protein CWB97_03555 [Pseudoalteromonas citrea]TMP59065.1 hypothetical protein CWB96_10910 [Pseudoalteromonas citrea]
MELVARYYRKLICYLVGYFYDGRVYRFTECNGSIQLKRIEKAGKVPPFVIVARQHYSEELKIYPIDEKKEVKKLLGLELNNKCAKYQINDTGDGKCRVNIWTFDSMVRHFRVIVPETYILANSLEHNEVLEILLPLRQEPLFVAKSQANIISSGQTSLLGSAELFSFSCGLPSGYISRVSKEHAECRLFDALEKNGIDPYIRFFTQFEKAGLQALCKAVLVPAFFSIAVYALASSSWLLWQKSRLSGLNDELGENIAMVIDAQIALDTNMQAERAMTRFFASQHSKSEVWLVLSNLISTTQFKSLRYSNGRYTVLGETERATEFMSKLVNDPRVVNAKFDYPVRNLKRGESFHISFEIKRLSGEAK